MDVNYPDPSGLLCKTGVPTVGLLVGSLIIGAGLVSVLFVYEAGVRAWTAARRREFETWWDEKSRQEREWEEWKRANPENQARWSEYMGEREERAAWKRRRVTA